MALSFESIAGGLCRLGVPREVAEKEARRQLGIVIPTATEERNANILEKEEQSEVRKLFLAFGFKVRNLSQARASKQSPGLGDLWVVHRRAPIAFWWETKRQVGGELSPDQIEFAEDCIRCNVGYGTGDRFDAQKHLIALGVAVQCGQTLEIDPGFESRLPPIPATPILSPPGQ